MKSAIVLLSGGLDSVTCLAIAQNQGFRCEALSFDYGQRHKGELQAAQILAQRYQVQVHNIVTLDFSWVGASALVDAAIPVPKQATTGIPVTYVPARNTLFLSYALAYGETRQIYDIFIGVNALDYSGYPDCRPAYIACFEQLANLGTKAGVEGQHFKIHTPLIDLRKSQIIQWGQRLGVDYGQTLSCYDLDRHNRACGQCDACRLRREGFSAAGVADPTHYR